MCRGFLLENGERPSGQIPPRHQVAQAGCGINAAGDGAGEAVGGQMADGGDVQALVADIASANSLKGVDVTAGQKLRIPVK